jgi:hypothetical protein
MDWPAWIEALGALATAAFTGILALATIRLWNSTKGLYDETKRLAGMAEEQSADMKASIAVAQKAAQAAEDSVRTMEDNSRRELRAYVGVESIVFECPSEKNMESYTPLDNTVQPPVYTDYLAVTVKNFGNTPARDVCVRSAILEVPGRVMAGIPDNFDIDTALGTTAQKSHETVPRAYLNRGQITVFKEVMHDVRILQRARNRESTVFQAGRIYYRDIYGRAWSTIYCYQWEPWHALGERFYPYERLNSEDQTPYPQKLGYMPSP